MLRASSTVLPWLASILRNVFLDTRRTGRARHEIAEHQLPADGYSPLNLARSTTPPPLAQAEQAQLWTWLQEELNALPSDHQLLLVLCDVEGFI